MLVEYKLEQWIKASLEVYKQHPLLVEYVFHEAGHEGFPTGVAPGLLSDTMRRWLPHEFAGGHVRYGDASFAIVDNDEQALEVTGDPSLVTDVEGVGYHIIPPAVDKLLELLQTQTFTVTTAFPQVPTALPAFSIRLERDAQSDTYIGESLESFILQGREVDANTARMTGSYLISVWSQNRLETLWLYAWLHNAALRSMQVFTTWGLSDVALSGSDIDPATQFLPERTYARHLLFTATRDERAISTQDVEYVSQLELIICAHYARIADIIPYPMGV